MPHWVKRLYKHDEDKIPKDLKKIAISGQRKVTQKLVKFVYPHLRVHTHFGSYIKKLKASSLAALLPDSGKSLPGRTGSLFWESSYL